MTAAAQANPFPGLRPFRESEAHLFFGRSAHVDELLAELARSRFVAVMGASASGKSSLVYAGVLPALHGGFAPRVGSHWRIATLRPGANPIHNLAGALAAPEVLGADDPDPLIATAQVEATLRRSTFGLADAARQSTALGDGRLLVVVDQFEELFRFHSTTGAAGVDADAEPFVQLLIEATRDDEAPIDVIITMRSDFLGECSQLRDLPEAVNQGLFLVPRLTRSQLREAITAPAAVGGATISTRLVQRLLNDAGADPDMLPVVQHALMRTWDTWAQDGGAPGPIDIAHYEACGAVEAALARHADEAYFGLEDDRRREIAELMFKRITELGDDHREVRRPTPLTEIAEVARATPAEVEACIRHFEEQGRSFVTVSADGIVDISHESLIRQWPRLNAWVREEADSRAVYRRLANAADRWERGEAALLRDPELQIASRWWKETEPNQAWADRYNPAFELAARYLDRSRRATRRRRAGAAAGVATLAILALVAALLAVWANGQKAEAQRQQRTAVARQLVASSVQAGPAQRSVSILAAIQAVRTTEQDGLRLPVAEDALRRAMKDPTGVKLPSGPAQQGSSVRTAFSPDGTLVATGGPDGRVRLWSSAAPAATPRLLPGDGASITALGFGTDGRWLAAGGDDGTTTLWDVTEPEPRPLPLADHAGGITALAFGGTDGRWLATGGLDGDLVLRRVDDPRAEPQRAHAHDGFVQSLAFSPDGTKLVTGGGDDIARVWTVGDLAAGSRELIGHGDDVLAVAFSPDGRSVATGGADNMARLWDLARPTSPVQLPHQGPVNTVTFSADGSWLATGSDDHVARLWNLHDPAGPAANPVFLKHDDAVDLVAFSSAGSGQPVRWLATGSRDSTARLFELRDLLADPVVLGGHEGRLGTMAFGGNDRWLVTGSEDGTARLWDLQHPAVEPAVLTGAGSDGETVEVAAVAFSPDGRLLATGASDKTVGLWDVDDRTAAPTVIDHENVPGFEKAGITALAFSPTGTLATGSGDRTVRLWNVGDLAAEPRQLPFDSGVTALAFSPDGSQLAVGVRGREAYVVDTGQPTASPKPFRGHTDIVTSVAFSSDGRLATGSRDGTVRLWTPGDQAAEPDVLDVHDPVTSLAFQPGGNRLAVGVGSTVQLWNLGDDDSSPAEELDAGTQVSGVAYSPDGQSLVVAAGGTVQLWDLGVSDPATSVANAAVLRDHGGPVTGVAFSPDGSRFASSSQDGTARVWLSLDALVDLGCNTVGRNLTHEEWRQLLPGDPYQKTCEQWPEGP